MVVMVAVGHCEHSFVFGQYFIIYMNELPDSAWNKPSHSVSNFHNNFISGFITKMLYNVHITQRDG